MAVIIKRWLSRLYVRRRIYRRRFVVFCGICTTAFFWLRTSFDQTLLNDVERVSHSLQKDDASLVTTKGSPSHLDDLATDPQIPTVPVAPTYDWKAHPQKYLVKDMTLLPTDMQPNVPLIQFTKESLRMFPRRTNTTENDRAKQVRLERQIAVKDAFEHAWLGYRKHAWMHDELKPLSGDASDAYCGWGATLIDALDTLWIMGFIEYFEEAVTAVAQIDFSTTAVDDISVFETNIRFLGGLLAAHDLTEGRYPVLLAQAINLGEMLYAVFDTPNRMPAMHWSPHLAMKGEEQQPGGDTLLAEIGSLSLEFTRLSQITGEPKWYDAISRITGVFEDHQDRTSLPGLWPSSFNASSKTFSSNDYTVGATADSAYEYLLKLHLLLGGTDYRYLEMYKKAVEAMKKHLFFQPMTPSNTDILFTAKAEASSILPDDDSDPLAITMDYQVEHLSCYVGGMFMLGERAIQGDEVWDDRDTAEKLTKGCLWAYDSSRNGIMADTMHVVPCMNKDQCTWVEDVYRKEIWDQTGTPGHTRQTIRDWNLRPGVTKWDNPSYLLRPEAIESLFVSYRITGDEVYRDRAWVMFETINRLTKTPIAHASLMNVVVEGPLQQMDHMESFWLAETLKYFYLIFADPEVISLDEWVFNTEAHPFRKPVPSEEMRQSYKEKLERKSMIFESGADVSGEVDESADEVVEGADEMDKSADGVEDGEATVLTA